jgi:hypothetical protein
MKYRVVVLQKAAPSAQISARFDVGYLPLRIEDVEEDALFDALVAHDVPDVAVYVQPWEEHGVRVMSYNGENLHVTYYETTIESFVHSIAGRWPVDTCCANPSWKLSSWRLY